MPGIGLRVLVLGAACSAGVATLVAIQLQAQGASSTFERDVAPIIYRHCASCHGAGGNAPFSLVNYDDVAPRAQLIAQVVRQKRMPPWKATLGGPFVGARSVSASDMLTLVRWAADGAPRGTWSGVAPPPPPAEWRLGVPDLVVTLPEPYIASPSGDDEIRTFVVPVPVTDTKYVEAVEISVGDGYAVRHADMRMDPTDSSRQRDREDDVPGFNDAAGVSAGHPDGFVLAWTPGMAATPATRGRAWRLEPGVDLVLQLDLRKTGSFELVRPRVAFYFTNRPPALLPLTLRLSPGDLEVAPETRFVARDRYTLPVDVELQAIHPHASYGATGVSVFARFPTGLERTLIQIEDWDVNWQDVYRHVEPVQLPRGTAIQVEFVYDPAARKRRDPDSPPPRVISGQNRPDEVWLQVLPKSAADRARLDGGTRH